jgi:hypothetical protein
MNVLGEKTACYTWGVLRTSIGVTSSKRNIIASLGVSRPVLTSRFGIDHPGETNSKEQKSMSTDEPTPTKLRQDQMRQAGRSQQVE